MSLADYISELIRFLGEAHPAALLRMRNVVGARRARIILDRESVDVSFDGGSFNVTPAGADNVVDGVGETDSDTVLDLLNGYLEVTEAILTGRMLIQGDTDDISRIFIAIEILLGASPRTPALQALAQSFEQDRQGRSRRGRPDQGRPTFYPFASSQAEEQLLARLELLPHNLTDAPGGIGRR